MSNGVSSIISEKGQGTYAWHVLHKCKRVQTSRRCLRTVEVVLVYFVHAVVNGKLDEFLKKLYVGADRFDWVAFVGVCPFVWAWLEVSSVIVVENQ